MAVRAITPEYSFAARDTQSNYGDNILLYIGWDHHTLFCSAKAFLISPQATFQQLLDELMPAGFSQHPDFAQINWATTQFVLDRQSIQPDAQQKLVDLGFGHKSLLRFITPELKGYNGTHV
ncbi:dimethylsulfoxide oxygenase epsilon subunit [Acinetobacter calcoaceticus]|uniref:Dimethylsulfoxide oxygenase epsilon subunit n=1 Tax=Acinetobacter calcoaceticus TaxID=471 RepID=A0A4R1Y0M2_ACICA|nr:dimethylsulfoxide oxygenase epsilon subunit [Acinetobacter calcoaceticus]